jgi:hypothetical protein
MISILIPTYNYNIYPLVFELKEQCDGCKIEYEILCLDDYSSIEYIYNEKINELDNCSFIKNTHNIGRASNINKLVQLSKFKYILILEADAFPNAKNYIKLYVKNIKLGKEAVFGGVIYSKTKPSKDSRLRWKYGNKRESKNLNYRHKNPYNFIFTWNFLIRKDCFLKNPFNTLIKDYGFEDLVFLLGLKINHVKIDHIQNLCIHHNEDTSIVFLNKYNSSLRNLKFIVDHDIITVNDTSLTKLYNFLSKTKLLFLVSFIFKFSKKVIMRNLLSKNPILFLFDIYKLGYYRNLKK